MILAFFSYRHGLPLTLRSALYPIIGERIYGPIGHAVDIFAVIGTVFGVATSLGYGVLQVNAGLNHLFGVPINETVQVILIVVITGLATISVVSGLEKGIRFLSELNLGSALLLGLGLAVGANRPAVEILCGKYRRLPVRAGQQDVQPVCLRAKIQQLVRRMDAALLGWWLSGRLSSVCSSLGFPAAEPSANLSRACCSSRPASPSCG